MTLPRTLPDGFAPYVWARTAAEVAASRGLPAGLVLRFDANVPALPGVPPVPLGGSFASLNEYPEGTYRDLREAAAAKIATRRARSVVAAASTSATAP